MNPRARSIFKSWIARGAAIAGVIAAGACNALVGLDDLEHVLPEDNGAACVDPIADCPAPEGVCNVSTCGQDGSCAVAGADVKTPCSAGGGVMCSAAGECVECVDDADCAAPLKCGGGGEPGACGCEAPCHVWSQLFSGSDKVLDTSYASNMAVHPQSGDVLLTGWFNGAFDIGKPSLTSAGSSDAFLARIDPSGSVRWSRRFGDAAEQLGFGVAATKEGDVLWTGSFDGTVSFDDTVVKSMGSRDAYVSKFSSDGALAWLQTSKGDTATIAEQFGVRVAEDAAGNVIVMGHFAGGLDFGQPASGVTPMDPPTVYDVFVVKFGPTGVHKWTKVFGDAKAQRGPGLAVDAMGNIFLAGIFAGVVDFGDINGPVDAGLGEDIFVVKLDPDGGFEWGKYYGNDQVQYVASIHVDKNGAVLVAMELVGTVNFGGGPLTSDDKDAIVLKLHGDGSYAWSRRFGGPEQQGAQAAIDDGNNGVLVAGRFSGIVDFGTGSISSQSGLDSVFLLKLDAASGATVWSRAYGTTGASGARELALDDSGHAILFGYTNGTIDFGGGPLINIASNSIFLSKFKL